LETFIIRPLTYSAQGIFGAYFYDIVKQLNPFMGFKLKKTEAKSSVRVSHSPGFFCRGSKAWCIKREKTIKPDTIQYAFGGKE